MKRNQNKETPQPTPEQIASALAALPANAMQKAMNTVRAMVPGFQVVILAYDANVSRDVAPVHLIMSDTQEAAVAMMEKISKNLNREPDVNVTVKTVEIDCDCPKCLAKAAAAKTSTKNN